MRLPSVLVPLLLLAAPVVRAEIVEGVAAVVNGEVVLLSEVEERVGQGLPPPGRDPATDKRRLELLHRAIEDLVAEKLVSAEANELGLAPSEQEVDAAVDEVMRTNKIDAATLEVALKQQGLTPERYREMLSNQLARMKLIEMKVKNRIAVSEDDVKARYAKLTGGAGAAEERHVRDIFLSKGDDPAAARAKIEAARKRVLAGEKFDAVAIATGGPLGSSGGDLGWVKRGMMLAELEQVAFALPLNTPSAVLDAAGGYHLLFVEERRAAGASKPLAEAREQIRQQLLQERMQKATEEYVTELRKTADVEIHLP